MSLGRNWLRYYTGMTCQYNASRLRFEFEDSAYEAEQGWELQKVSIMIIWLEQGINALTVFFFARSPEAPRTTMTVLSLSSMALD